MTRFGISVPTCANAPWTTCADADSFSAVLDGCQHVPIPWHRKQSGTISVQPLEIFSFWTVPGPGSRMGQLRPCPIPSRGRNDLLPVDDDRFTKTIKKGSIDPLGVRLGRWRPLAGKNGHDRWDLPDDEKFQEKRKIKTGLAPLGDIPLSAKPSTQATSDAAAFPISSAATCASSTCSTELATCQR